MEKKISRGHVIPGRNKENNGCLQSAQLMSRPRFDPGKPATRYK